MVKDSTMSKWHLHYILKQMSQKTKFEKEKSIIGDILIKGYNECASVIKYIAELFRHEFLQFNKSSYELTPKIKNHIIPFLDPQSSNVQGSQKGPAHRSSRFFLY